MSGSEQLHERPDRPLVSVIIPTFNRERFLPQALGSAFAQDYRPIEVVVVDDGSTDGTIDLLRTWPDAICIRQTHRGISAARNAGIAASRGSILAFLDSDDLWPANRLTIAVAQFEARPEIGYVLGKQMLFLEPGYDVPSWIKPEWLAIARDVAGTGVLMVRRETWLRVGGFNAELTFGEDTDWLIRASQAKIPMVQLPEVLVHSRLHGDNLMSQISKRRTINLAHILRDAIRRRDPKNP